ncbi:MAG TPA: undecaprenyldiphospho-muramoylpentapeptide beta-N-acetylglucosaminyltransferase [Desulfobulbaceae bacterium]|nr:undecaprenyldiphospho-muramoylpentapeptide beta-N-acetylglucosaminyltransferase [Desulfobulbaceae bacterium]
MSASGGDAGSTKKLKDDLKRRQIRLLLTGGGTGGHLFPAVAAAQEFQRQIPGTAVLFVGTKRKVDTKSLSSYCFPSENIRCYGLKGKNPLELLRAITYLPVSFFQAHRIIRRFKPDLVLGVGGYVTGPVMVAAKSLGIPTVIHEQNSVPGLANRKLGGIVDRICLSLPGSEARFPAGKIVYTGNPVRKEILALAENRPPRLEHKKTLAILGGSQGAQAVNRLVAEALPTLPEGVRQRLRVIHQTGEHDAAYVREQYEKSGMDALVQPFFTDMAGVYGQADLLVSRAGATTLSEIAVVGSPAILIPYPFAADNHQEINGNYYVNGGGAIQFRQSELSVAALAGEIAGLIQDEQKLTAMGNAMKKLSFPDAAAKIVACCQLVLKER